MKLPAQLMRQIAEAEELYRQLYGDRVVDAEREQEGRGRMKLPDQIARQIAAGKEIERQLYGERSLSPNRFDRPKTWGRVIITSMEDEDSADNAGTGITGDKDGSIGAALAMQDRRAERAIQHPSRKRDALRQPDAWRLLIDELVKSGVKLSGASTGTRIAKLIKDVWAITGTAISAETARNHAANLKALARRIADAQKKANGSVVRIVRRHVRPIPSSLGEGQRCGRQSQKPTT